MVRSYEFDYLTHYLVLEVDLKNDIYVCNLRLRRLYYFHPLEHFEQKQALKFEIEGLEIRLKNTQNLINNLTQKK